MGAFLGPGHKCVCVHVRVCVCYEVQAEVLAEIQMRAVLYPLLHVDSHAHNYSFSYFTIQKKMELYTCTSAPQVCLLKLAGVTVK